MFFFIYIILYLGGSFGAFMLLYTCISMYNHISCIFSIAIKVVLIIIAFFCYVMAS